MFMDRRLRGTAKGDSARKTAGLLLTAFLFALYGAFPYFGAVSMQWVLIRFAGYFAISLAACLLVYKAAGWILPKMHCIRIETVLYDKWSDKVYFLIVWGILTVSWIPAYLAFFPGIFGYDAPNQMEQIISNQYTAHHPLLHTLLLRVFLNCGKGIFGSYNGGVALFCIFQGLVLSSSIAYSFLIMKVLKMPVPILLVSLIWCIWSPVLQVLTFNTTKDILFGALFLHFVINCYYWLMQGKKKTIVQMAWLIVSGVLMCLLRNQGIYIVAALLVISVFVCWNNKKFLVSLCVIIVASQSFFWVSNHVFGIQKGDAREMLSVPMQQTALVCKLYMEGEAVQLTPEEFEKFSLLVDKEHIPDLHLSTADPIKMYFNTEVLKQDISGYISLYLTVGGHNLGTYLTAFRCLAYPYWDMSEGVARDISITNTFPELSESWGIYQNSLLPGYKEYLSRYILYEMDEKIPIISWFLQPGLCIWMMTALLGVAIAGKNKAVFLTALTGMLFMGTLLLGPVALLRYIYPLMILAPWFLAVLCGEVFRTGGK